MSVQWPLVIFTLFVTLGAGIMCITGVFAVMGKDKEFRMPAIVSSVIAIVIGGCASALHLQHAERIFNGFGHITSGITQELICIVVFVIVAVVYFALARKGDTPKWVGILAIAASVLLVVFMSHSYTMASLPAWNNMLLYAFYLANAFLLGTLGVAVLQALKGIETKFASKLLAIAGGVQALVVVAYGLFVTTLGDAYTSVGYYFDSTNPTQGITDASAAVSGFLTGDNALLFWGGALLLGALVPLLSGIVSMKRSGAQVATLAGAGAVCALVGGIAFRVILYNLGYSSYMFF